MTAKPLFLILGIIHSKFAKHAAHRIMDEHLAKAIKPALQKIGEGIEQLKIKDLKVSQDQLKALIVRLKNKYGEETSKDCNETLSSEIESALKDTQNSAMAGLSSGLGSLEQVSCLILTNHSQSGMNRDEQG